MSSRLTAALGVLLVVALIALGVTWRAERHQVALHDAGVQAERAARTVATALTTYDYRHLGAQRATVRSLGTSRFQRYFGSVSGQSAKAVVSLRATATGKVLDAAPDVADTSHVAVLLFVDQTVTGKGIRGTRTEEPRMRLSMVEVGGRWLVDAVELENVSG